MTNVFALGRYWSLRAEAMSPLPVYVGHEQLRGRLRAPIPRALFVAAFDRDGHDTGDEDRYGGLP